MEIAELERFYERITMQAVAETVVRLLTHPFGFHGDTGIRDYLYARLLHHGQGELESNDPQGRPIYSTLLLQSEHKTAQKYGRTGGRFDLALVLPPESPDNVETRFAENLTACFAFELGKNKALVKVIDPAMKARDPKEALGTSDILKLYHELAFHGLRQGWVIEFYDSRVPNAALTIEAAIKSCLDLPLGAGKKLVVIFVGFSPDGENYVSSNDPDVERWLIGRLLESHIKAGRDLEAYKSKPAPGYLQGGK